jgi:hypothetical protein
MSDIDRTMKPSTQSTPEPRPIAKLDGNLNAAGVYSKSDRTGGESDTLRPKVIAFTAKPAPSTGRRPLFRR